jgi:hypothetical protein
MGLATYTSAARLSRTACERSTWESDTSVRCKTGLGLVGSHRAMLTAGRRAGSVTQSLSIVAFSISLVLRANRGGTGSSSVTIYGAGLGPMSHTVSMRLGMTTCERTAWQSDTSVRCQLGFSSLQTRHIVITAGVQASSTTQSFSHDRLHLSGVGIYRNIFPFVPPLLTIFGMSFGLTDDSPVARVGQTTCEASIWTSQSAILCRIASGIAANDHITVTVGVHYNTISRIFIYDSPVISAASPRNCAAPDSVQTTVFGLRFGRASVSNTLRIGGTPCETSMWISDSTMLCKPASGFARPKLQLPIVLSLGGASGFAQSDYFFTLTMVIRSPFLSCCA